MMPMTIDTRCLINLTIFGTRHPILKFTKIVSDLFISSEITPKEDVYTVLIYVSTKTITFVPTLVKMYCLSAHVLRLSSSFVNCCILSPFSLALS